MAFYTSVCGVDVLAIANICGVDAPASGGLLTDAYPSSQLADASDTSVSQRPVFSPQANATPFADGSYTQIDASLSADASGIWVYMTLTTSQTGLDTSTVLEIATGAAASEVNWANVQVGFRNAVHGYFVPGFITSGTRVAARVRSAVANQFGTCRFGFFPADKSVDPITPVTMGYTPSAAAGVVLPTPGATNSEGAWVEIAAATSGDFGNLLVNIGGGRTNTQAAGDGLIDIGIGAAAAETVLISDIHCSTSTAETCVPRSPLTFGVDIPSGSRLSARQRSSSTSCKFDVFLVGA